MMKSGWITPMRLMDIAVGAGVAALAAYHVRRALASRKAESLPSQKTIHTWEGEGGNVVAPQPSDHQIAPTQPSAAVGP